MKQILSILFTIIVTTSCTAEYGEDIPYKSVDVDYTFNLAVDGRSVSTRSLAAATDENSLSSNPQLSSSASFLRLNVLSSLN